MKFRFTLSNTIAGSIVIDEPGGWDSAVLKLERNEEYHSLVEFYELPAIFYRSAYDYLTAIENSQGPDAQVTVLVERSEDTTWETVTRNLVDVSTVKGTDFYKSEMGFIRNDFWQKFINRKGTPVDLVSTTDIDGNTRTTPAKYTLSLPSQQMRQQFDAVSGRDVTYTTVPINQWGVIDFDTIVKDEITTRIPSPAVYSAAYPPEGFTFDWAGTYDISIWLYANDGSGAAPGAGKRTTAINAYMDIVQSGVLTSILLTRADHGVPLPAGPGYTDFQYTGTKTFNVGDSLTLYFKNTGVAPETFTWIKYYTNFLRITAATTYTDTTTDAFYLGEAATSIISKLTGQNGPLTSSFLNSACGKFALMKGLHLRGYSFTDKPFFMSFDDWWAGANPILNLGLGYTNISGTDYIEIEKKEDFYNVTPVLNLDYVNKIERSYNTKYIFKSIEVGYQKWQAESDGGIDDPQSKRTYHTRFKTVGEDVSFLSKFVGASLAIEQTRRNRKEFNKDWRMDEDVMIIALKSSDRTIPERSENFTSVSGLLSYATRYNIRISAGRIFNNWKKYFNGCLKWYDTNKNFTFASGEGNMDMVSTLSASADCPGDGVAFSEKQNITGGYGQPFMFVPIVYDFEHPLTWNEYKAIRDNRKHAIGISRTSTGHAPCHILNLEYQLTRGRGKFTVLLGQATQL